MTGKDEFLKAKKMLEEHVSHADKTKGHWNLVYNTTWLFDNSNAWSFLYEVIQNAVDAGATTINISFDEDACLRVSHNGTELLNHKSIQGICGFSMSSKDLDSVGFMGIGFKSFLGFFSKVTVHDKNVRFSTEAPRTGNSSQPNVKKLYYPEWIDESQNLPDEMTTSFQFVEPTPNTLGRLEEACDNFDPLWLAVFGSRNLKTLVLQDRVFEFANKAEGVQIACTTAGFEKSWHYMILEEAVSLDETSIRELKVRRNRRDDETQSVQKTVRLLKEITIIEEEGKKRIIPKEMDAGEMFCLVPLGKDFSFPFKIGVDSDWLVNPTRTALVQEDSAHHYHKSLLSQLPNLLKKYFDSLPPDMSATDRKACLSIFPEINEEISPALSYLESEEFYDSMKESISDSKFILCIDGEIRSPNEVRDFPKKPEKMTEAYYKSFINECFSCQIVDKDSISTTAIEYLRTLGFFAYPEENEIKTKEIQDKWKDGSKKHYLHLLDILHDIVPNPEVVPSWKYIEFENAHGPEVVPCEGDHWASLRDPMLSFQRIPKKNPGLEKPLYDILVQKHPEVAGARVAEKAIRRIKKPKNYRQKEPGWKWRDYVYESGMEIIGKIEKLDIPEDKENVLSVYRYALRTNTPKLVKYLHTNDSSGDGCKPPQECLIGPPFGDEILRRLAPKSILSIELVNASKGKGLTHEHVERFLTKVGAVSFVPIKKETNLVEVITGPRGGKSKEYDYDTANQFLGDDIYGYGAGKLSSTGYLRSVDWVWPISLSKCDPEILAEYLGNVDENERLKEAIEGAKRKRTTEYERNGPHSPPSKNKLAKWLDELINHTWVPCADGVFRKPRDSKHPGIDEERKGAHSMLDDSAMEYFINNNKCKLTFGENLPDDPSARIEYWKLHLVNKHIVEFRKTLKKIVDEGQADHHLDDILLIKMRTGGKEQSAPIRRFLRDPRDDYDGFFGNWEAIDTEVSKLLQKCDYQPEENITDDLAKEYVGHVKEKYPEKIPLGIFENLRKANTIILGLLSQEWRTSISGFYFFTYGNKWIAVDKNEHYYVQTTHDILRFQEMRDRILHPHQFPEGIETLEELLEFDQIILIDDHVEVTSEIQEQSEETIPLRRVLQTLNLNDISVSSTKKDGIEVEIDDTATKVHYLIRTTGVRKELCVSGNSKHWAGPVSQFMCEQSGGQSEGTREKIRICIQSTGTEFKQQYALLEDDGFELFTDELPINHPASPQSESEAGAEAEDQSNAPPRSGKGRIREPLEQIREVTKDEQERERKPSKRKQKPKAPGQPEGKRVDIKGKPESDPEAKKIGDKAEEIVLNHLLEEGWAALSWNDEFGVERIGHDLVVKKGKEIRVVEVKGHKGTLKGAQPISEAQLRMGVIYHGETPSNHPDCRYSVWLYVVENVFDGFNILPPASWPGQKIAAYFPRDPWFPRSSN